MKCNWFNSTINGVCNKPATNFFQKRTWNNKWNYYSYCDLHWNYFNNNKRTDLSVLVMTEEEFIAHQVIES